MMRPYTEEVIIFNLQHAIRSGRRFRDGFNRQSVLESKGDLYVITPVDMGTGTVIDRTLQSVGKKPVDLVVPEERPEELPEVASTILDERRVDMKFPADAIARFEDPILNSYVFDHALTEAERIAFLKKNGTLFSDRLKFTGDTPYLVLGANKFEPTEVPVGRDETAYRAWKKDLVEKFVANKDKIFVSVKDEEKLKDRKPTISKFKIEGDKATRVVDPKAKNYLPTVCGTGRDITKEDLRKLAKFLDKKEVGVPDDLPGDQVCTYIDLLAREEHNCVWITPEELSVLYKDDETRKIFTAEFKK